MGAAGALDSRPSTLSVAVFATAAPGRARRHLLGLKTVGAVHERSERLARRLWLASPRSFVVVSFETGIVRPELYQAMLQRPFAWIALVILGAGAWALWTGVRGSDERRALAGSCAIIVGLLAGAAASLFPRGAALDAQSEAFLDGLRGAPLNVVSERLNLVAGCRRPRPTATSHHAHLRRQGAPRKTPRGIAAAGL